MLVDADNVRPARVQPVLDLVAWRVPDALVVGSGRHTALAALAWPVGARLLTHAGWQAADIALAAAYSPAAGALLLVTGDGDFGLLAARHPGPVLVISGAASNRLRDSAMVLDPATDGLAPVAGWLDQVCVNEP